MDPSNSPQFSQQIGRLTGNFLNQGGSFGNHAHIRNRLRPVRFSSTVTTLSDRRVIFRQSYAHDTNTVYVGISSSVPLITRSVRGCLIRCDNREIGGVAAILDGLEGGELMSLFWIAIRQLADIEEMATPKKVITREEWDKKLNDVKIRKEDMNKLVMNFLVTEGYVDAAEKFRIESGTQPDIDLATITDCMAVKKAVQCGNVEDAIEKVNDLNPEILDTNPQLFFHLQQQRLIELIRNGKVEEALEFAQEELAPRGEENQSFLEDLERTVGLLAFEDVPSCPVGELLDISQRIKTACEVNAAILTSQCHEKGPKLPSLLKMLIWAQNQLDEKAAYPRINDFSTARLEDPAI